MAAEFRERAGEILVLPFAAASSFMLHGLAQQLSGIAKVRVYDLPGHGLRFEEPMLCDARAVIDDLVHWVGNINGPLVLFGHCLGAFLAAEVRYVLREQGQCVGTVYSGYISDPPSRRKIEQSLSADRDALFELYVSEGLIRADSIPSDMEDYVKEMVWADSRLMKDMLRRDRKPFLQGDVPVVLWGDEDPLYRLYGMSDEAETRFSAGGHLYFLNDARSVVDAVRNTVALLEKA